MSSESSQEAPVDLSPQHQGKTMHALMAKLFPMHRSITGNGVRETLRTLQNIVPLSIREIPSGTEVFGWQVPNEWNVRDAWIKGSNGQRLVDFQASNLHIVGYSQSVQRTMSWQELEPHLRSIPEHPEWIPFRSSPFDNTWGFCVTHKLLESLRSQGADTEYEVCIDADLNPGSLTYGEVFLPGATTDEVLISTHICHPSLANDNLSGVVVTAFMAAEMARSNHQLSYRFLFVPATLGPIAWLATNEQVVDRIRHGLVLACLGDAGKFNYKKSRRGNAAVDRATQLVMLERGVEFGLREFSPFGCDERQYCSCGFNLPLGKLTRTPDGEYPEYHSSADNLDFVRPQYLAESLTCCLDIVEVLDTDGTYYNKHPYCEPHLRSHGLYEAYGKSDFQHLELQKAVQWVLNLSDGTHSLLDIAERSGITYGRIREAAQRLIKCELLSATLPD